MKRRKFLKKTALALAGAATFSGLYAWQIEPFWVEFVQRDLPLAHLPSEFQGKTLMQISDMHVGNRFDYHYLIKALQQAQQFTPDLLVYTGDYVSYENEAQFTQLKEVLAYAPRGKLASFGILGNHDYGKNWAQTEVADNITAILEAAGIQVLRNAQESIKGLNIIGLDDYWSPNFKPQDVLQNLAKSEANIVLCHNPDVCDLPLWQGYQGWILAGHTHGGQVKPPFLPPPILPVQNQRYTAGEIDLEAGRKLYINRALGHLWQVRFNVRPEITIFTLIKA